MNGDTNNVCWPRIYTLYTNADSYSASVRACVRACVLVCVHACMRCVHGSCVSCVRGSCVVAFLHCIFCAARRFYIVFLRCAAFLHYVFLRLQGVFFTLRFLHCKAFFYIAFFAAKRFTQYFCAELRFCTAFLCCTTFLALYMSTFYKPKHTFPEPMHMFS